MDEYLASKMQLQPRGGGKVSLVGYILRIEGLKTRSGGGGIFAAIYINTFQNDRTSDRDRRLTGPRGIGSEKIRQIREIHYVRYTILYCNVMHI
jgi:hypothetical protein